MMSFTKKCLFISISFYLACTHSPHHPSSLLHAHQSNFSPKSVPFKKKNFKKKTINQKSNHMDFLRQHTSLVLIAQRLSKGEMPLNTRSSGPYCPPATKGFSGNKTFLIKIRVGQNGSSDFLSRPC